MSSARLRGCASTRVRPRLTDCRFGLRKSSESTNVSVVASFEPSGHVRSFRGPLGEITLWFPGGEIAAGRVVGEVRAAATTSVFQELDRRSMSHGHPGLGFIDLSEMTGFDWESRMILVRWNLAHRKQASRLHLLAWSRAAHLGVRVLTIALGDLVVSHATRASFEAASAAALRRV
jgi:hypothetical protein